MNKGATVGCLQIWTSVALVAAWMTKLEFFQIWMSVASYCSCSSMAGPRTPWDGCSTTSSFDPLQSSPLVASSSSSTSSPRYPLPLALKGPIPPFFSPSSMGRPWNQVIVLCVFDELWFGFGGLYTFLSLTGFGWRWYFEIELALSFFVFKSNVKAWLMLVLFSVFALFVSLFMVLCSFFLVTLLFLF